LILYSAADCHLLRGFTVASYTMRNKVKGKCLARDKDL